METIVALATPAGNGGVAVIRISGEKSKNILQKITKTNEDFSPRKMYLKNVYANNLTDKCLVVFFESPFSYTGEDVAEIQSHGGYLIAEKIIEECISLGCRLAGAGEFSKRAFINGKMSLDQAEGVMDLINAESDMQASSAGKLLNGKLKEKIDNLQSDLTDILADIEAKLDYPEYDYDDKESNNTKEKIKNILNNLNSLILESKSGLKIKQGVNISIVGAPNVGKSSLLNALTKSNKAIVTEIAGTTRDVVEAEYEYNGIIFRLFDTAGIHESQDIVEKIGIDRALETIKNADLVVRVSAPNYTCNIETNKPFIDIFNKSDLVQCEDKKYFYVSAKDNKNIDELKQIIFVKTIGEALNGDKFYLTNTRHIECINRAIKKLNKALDIFNTTTFDIISLELKQAWNSLGEVSGVVSNEEILDRVFSKFCLGK